MSSARFGRATRRPAAAPAPARRSFPGLLPLLALPWLLVPTTGTAGGPWIFNDVTASAGFSYQHGYVTGIGTDARAIAGGLAAGDYDNDGWIDVYAVRGDVGANVLMRNLGNGTFADVAAAAGVALSGTRGSGPAFADYDGDGHLDLFVGGIEGTFPVLFRNLGNGTFTDVTAAAGLNLTTDTFSAAFGDYNHDGHLDLLTTHWRMFQGPGHLWRNDGDGTFTEVDSTVGLTEWGDYGGEGREWTFTGNFVDLNSDGWSDLVFSSDFGTSQVYLNDGDGTFTNTTTAVISDENGMGSAIGDYDNDGDLDWFVSSIFDTTTSLWGRTGNRMYQNQGDGSFVDATEEAGVRHGWWGWGSSFADFNNDGNLDLYHGNGWYQAIFRNDPARIFISNGDATFTEMGNILNVDHQGQSRGLACFDYDRDGDIDVLLANNGQKAALYRNDGGNDSHWLTVQLAGPAPNTEGIGSRVFVTAGGVTQMRELRAGCNFVSQDPAEAHFGTGAHTTVDVRVEWVEDGLVTQLDDVAVDQLLEIDRGATAVPLPAGIRSHSAITWRAVEPNPSRGSVSIRFALDRGGPVLLRVHDATGRLVRAVHREFAAEGEHDIGWDGRADDGRPVAAGIYFVELEARGARAKGSVTLLR
ncbi:MAG: RNA-binding protein [Gemmatimonadota bacterium]|nr:MAG: RNA-binding protein [Gemmatimonadota bacterium]